MQTKNRFHIGQLVNTLVVETHITLSLLLLGLRVSATAAKSKICDSNQLRVTLLQTLDQRRIIRAWRGSIAIKSLYFFGVTGASVLDL